MECCWLEVWVCWATGDKWLKLSEPWVLGGGLWAGRPDPSAWALTLLPALGGFLPYPLLILVVPPWLGSPAPPAHCGPGVALYTEGRSRSCASRMLGVSPESVRQRWGRGRAQGTSAGLSQSPTLGLRGPAENVLWRKLKRRDLRGLHSAPAQLNGRKDR